VRQARTRLPSIGSPSPAHVVEIDPAGDPRWDAMVGGHRDASVYHLGAWAGVLRSAYGHRPSYLALETSDGTVIGGLPLMRMRGLVTGRRMSTLPAVPPAGPLADTDDGARALLEAAMNVADGFDARIWTLHARHGGLEAIAPRLLPRPKHPAYVLPLGVDPDELRAGLKKSSRNLWRSLKKADESGVVVREGKGRADLRAFYSMYARAMRRRRVLPRPYRQVAAAQELLPEGVFRLYLAEYEGHVVGGMIGHAFGETLELLYLGSDERRFDCRPNHALYWHAIRWATEAGYTELDLGHANPGSSLATFKQQWGAEPIPEYRYDYVPGAAADSEAPAESRAPAKLAEGRESDSLVARAIERMPLFGLRAAARVVYRRL
jgi:CelD/BcsL family acetyltransferase involved in cellulose biosynthesis